MIARAGGPAGMLARTVKVSDLKDRLRHPGPWTGGSRPPYERAVRLIPAPALPPSSGVGQFRFDRSVDVAVDVVGSDAVDDSVGLQDRVDLRLDPR
jgi:hypothetical protein